MLIGIIWLRYSKNTFVTKALKRIGSWEDCLFSLFLLFIGPELGDLEPHNIAFDNTLRTNIIFTMVIL